MRNYTSDERWNGPYAEGTAEGFGALRTVALVGAVALIATPFIMSLMQRRRVPRSMAASEPAIDESLEETFPASDPPASRYFDIPENRL
jgi:hypothetical protein